jgi:hypothetical protein
MAQRLTSGVGYKPHRDTTPLIRDLNMVRNAISSLPTEGQVHELSVLRAPLGDSLLVHLRIDAPPVAEVVTETVAVEIDDEAETLPILPKA